MKRALSFAAICASLIVFAADSTPVGPDETEITSNRFVFDQRAEMVHFEESVKVTNPGVLALTCEDLVAKLPKGGGVESIVATTNVVIQFIQGKSTNYATGDRAVYTKTNEVFTLTGAAAGKRPRLFQEGMSVEANIIVLNLANGQYKFEGNPVFRGKLGSMRGFDAFGKSTNNPAR